MAQFDVAGARKAGYSDKEIAHFLADEAGIDANAAREHYNDAEIIAEFGGVGAEPVAKPPKATEPEAEIPAAEPERKTAIVETPTKVVMGPSESDSAPKLPEGFAEQYRQYINDNLGKLTVEGLESFVKAKTGVLPDNAQEVVDFQNTYGAVSPDARAVRKPVVKPRDDAMAAPIAAGLGAEDVATFGLSPHINNIIKLAGQSEANAAFGQEASPNQSYGGALEQTRAEMGGYQQEHPLAYLGGQLGGAAVSFGKMPTSISGLARQGALQGGAYSAGSALGQGQDLSDVALQGSLGALGGAGAGALLGGAAKAFPKRALAPERVQQAAMAAERQGLDVPATLVSPKKALTAKDLGDQSQRVVQGAEGDLKTAIGDRSGAMALDYGAPALDAMDLGQRVQKGAASWIKAKRGEAQKLYDEGEKLTEGLVVPPTGLTNTLNAKRDELMRLPKTNKALIDVINDVASDIGNVQLQPKDFRKLRSDLWARLSAGELGLSPSDKTRLVTEITGSATKDMRNALETAATQKGGEKYAKALAAFDQGDKLWREQSKVTKTTLSAILGKSADDILETSPDVWGADLSPEKATAAIQRFTGKEHRRLVQLMGTLDDTTKGTVRASLIQGLGREGDGFSPSKFVKQLDAIPERTQRALFGSDGVSALNDLKKVSGLLTDPVGKGQKTSYWMNRVKYALLSGGAGLGAATVLAPTGAGQLAGVGTAAALLLGKKQIADPIAAKILASPKLAKDIAALARAGNPDTRRQMLQSIAAYGTRVPEVRDAVQTFVERMVTGAKPDDKPLVIGGKREEPVADEPEEAEPDDAAVRAAILGQEGTGKNPSSSAVGKGQFIDGTFAAYAKKILPEETEGMDDEAIASMLRGRKLDDGTPIEDRMLDMSMADSKAMLADLKQPASPGNLYLAHFLGANDLPTVLKAPKDKALVDVLRPEVISANEAIAYKGKHLGDMTVGDLIGWSADVMGRRLKSAR
jgi:hypothetical protein